MGQADAPISDVGLLAVSFHYPPAAEPQAIQVANLLAAWDGPLLVAHGVSPLQKKAELEALLRL